MARCSCSLNESWQAAAGKVETREWAATCCLEKNNVDKLHAGAQVAHSL